MDLPPLLDGAPGRRLAWPLRPLPVLPQVTTLRELKGAPVSCLLALYVLGRPARKEEIADFTGYESGAVQSALRCLSRPGYNLVLALPNGRHPLWDLTAHARQMPLSWAVLTDSYVAMSREKTDSSSSSSLNKGLTDSSLQLLPLQEVSREKTDSSPHNAPPPAPEADRLANLLQDLGCPRLLARASVAGALADDSPELVEAQVILWRHYCASPAGQSIQAVGIFVARKLQNGERAPSSARQSLKQLPHPEATGQPWDPARDWPHPDYVRLLELTEETNGEPDD